MQTTTSQQKEEAEKRYMRVLKSSLCEGFIQTMDNKDNTHIGGVRGVPLSGGQIQRLSIARAMYKDADIVILDEPTSALDVFTEEECISELLKWIHLDDNSSKTKTVLMSSHRIQTLLSMDRILVFDNGKIIEDRCPKDLIVNPSTVLHTMYYYNKNPDEKIKHDTKDDIN